MRRVFFRTFNLGYVINFFGVHVFPPSVCLAGRSRRREASGWILHVPVVIQRFHAFHFKNECWHHEMTIKPWPLALTSQHILARQFILNRLVPIFGSALMSSCFGSNIEPVEPLCWLADSTSWSYCYIGCFVTYAWFPSFGNLFSPRTAWPIHISKHYHFWLGKLSGRLYCPSFHRTVLARREVLQYISVLETMHSLNIEDLNMSQLPSLVYKIMDRHSNKFRPR